MRSRCIGWTYAAVVAAMLAGSAVAVSAGDPAPFSARAGLEVARDAALTWAPDARLVYIENDEDVSADGNAVRWGYLFYSQNRGKARGYSVRDGKILEATDLGFDIDPPPLAEGWIDSPPAHAAAAEEAAEYCLAHNGRLSAMLLMRGAFDEKKPNNNTWTLVYKAAGQPSLFVVVDAAAGDVIRTWRG